jgi:prepilin-type processing-associated H-X9-DG protein
MSMVKAPTEKIILAGLLLPSLSKAKEANPATVCKNNQRQLALALHLYVADFDGIVPSANGAPSVWPDDWLYWPTEWGDPEYAIERSPICRYTAGFQTNLFRGPSDSFLRALDSGRFPGDKSLSAKQLYRFSYTLSHGYVPGTPPHYGIASFFRRPDWPWEKVCRSRLGSVLQPADKIMFAEEATYGDRAAQQNPSPLGTQWSSGWDWPDDPLADRHGGPSNEAFVDGHIEAVRPAFGKDPRHYDPHY